MMLPAYKKTLASAILPAGCAPRIGGMSKSGGE